MCRPRLVPLLALLVVDYSGRACVRAVLRLSTEGTWVGHHVIECELELETSRGVFPPSHMVMSYVM